MHSSMLQREQRIKREVGKSLCHPGGLLGRQNRKEKHQKKWEILTQRRRLPFGMEVLFLCPSSDSIERLHGNSATCICVAK